MVDRVGDASTAPAASGATGSSPAPAPAVGGEVAAGFEGVREAFLRNFAEHGEMGAGVAVYVHGRKVVDLWGGLADRHGTSYGEDTLQLVFSTTKGVTALCANLLAQQGELDVDAPVLHYWPEFAAAGKHDVPVRWLLSHRVGLPYVDAQLSLEEVLAWDPVVEALARQAPVWTPGTKHGYHAITFGWLVGEVVRRITGQSLGSFVAKELSEPLGLELWVGLPDDQQSRVAPLTNRGPDGSRQRGMPLPRGLGVGREPKDFAALVEQLLGPDALLPKALGAVGDLFTQRGMFNRPEVRAAELPAANAVSNARSLAKLYAAVIGEVDGHGPLLTPAQIAAATTAESDGPDKVLIVQTAFGLGYMVSSSYSLFGGRQAFGHTGVGGSMAFADPEAGIGFAYVMNRMIQSPAGDPRSQGLVRAVYEALGLEAQFV
jgi:CubicO group peptidase (beta-lactamase class C family)